LQVDVGRQSSAVDRHLVDVGAPSSWQDASGVGEVDSPLNAGPQEAVVRGRRVLQVGTLVWVVAGGAVALSSLGNVNDDARQAVGVASVAGPLLGAWAALLMGRLADRSAGVVLMLSAVLTPTYFAYVLNLPALLVGAVLAVAG
jgi:hypothetical protein